MKTTDETLALLEKGIKELFHSDRYKHFLIKMGQFHKYSFNNCVLIFMQRPDASFVAGYKVWEYKFHRHVKNGEHGITIISPTEHVIEKPVFEDGKPVFNDDGMLVTETVKKCSFHTATVFDVSQTEGEPLPNIVKPLTGPVEGFYEYLRAIEALSPVPVRFEDISQNGYYSPDKQEIVIKRGLSEEQTIKTLLHECSHALLSHGVGDDRRTCEVQAESVAFCCCNAFGIDSSEFSFGYVTEWSSGKDLRELKDSLDMIRDTSNKIIKSVEKHFIETARMQTARTEERRISL